MTFITFLNSRLLTFNMTDSHATELINNLTTINANFALFLPILSFYIREVFPVSVVALSSFVGVAFGMAAT